MKCSTGTLCSFLFCLLITLVSVSLADEEPYRSALDEFYLVSRQKKLGGTNILHLKQANKFSKMDKEKCAQRTKMLGGKSFDYSYFGCYINAEDLSTNFLSHSIRYSYYEKKSSFFNNMVTVPANIDVNTGADVGFDLVATSVLGSRCSQCISYVDYHFNFYDAIISPSPLNVCEWINFVDVPQGQQPPTKSTCLFEYQRSCLERSSFDPICHAANLSGQNLCKTLGFCLNESDELKKSSRKPAKGPKPIVSKAQPKTKSGGCDDAKAWFMRTQLRPIAEAATFVGFCDGLSRLIPEFESSSFGKKYCLQIFRQYDAKKFDNYIAIIAKQLQEVLLKAFEDVFWKKTTVCYTVNEITNIRVMSETNIKKMLLASSFGM